MPISSALGSSALLPAGLGFRNKIINGDFRINQRAFTSSTSSLAFGHDRWFHEFNGGTCTYTTQSFNVGSPVLSGYESSSFARLTNSGQSAASNYYAFVQRIEDVRNGDNCIVTVSFYARSGSGTPSVAVELEQVFGSGGSTRVLTYGGKVTLSTSWTRYSVQVVLPSITGKTIGLSSFISVNLWVSAGSDFSSRTGSIGIQNNTFDFWGVQFEQNFQPTPFEQRPIGVELQLCQRYYETSYNGVPKGTNTTVGVIYASSTTDPFSSFVLPLPLWSVIKRTSPTVTTYTQAGTINKWNCSRSGVTDSEVALSLAGAYSSPRSQLLYISMGAAYVSATGYGHFVADAEL
jgi:hypothetical protein